MIATRLLSIVVATLACGIVHAATTAKVPEFVGTDAPFASNPIYFVMTDRFVNGDPSNDQRHQGSAGLIGAGLFTLRVREPEDTIAPIPA